MAYSGTFGLRMPNTSPLRKPRAAKPAATRRTDRSNSLNVITRPVNPSMTAGRSLNLAASRKTNSVKETFGMVTSGNGPRKIMTVRRLKLADFIQQRGDESNQSSDKVELSELV